MPGKFNEGYFDELGNSGSVLSLIVGQAERIAAAARASAPVDSGEYRDSIHVEVVQAGHRKVARVIADAPHSMLVESKTGNLARSVRAAGG